MIRHIDTATLREWAGSKTPSGGANSFVAILHDDATLVTEVAGVAGATFKKQ